MRIRSHIRVISDKARVPRSLDDFILSCFELSLTPSPSLAASWVRVLAKHKEINRPISASIWELSCAPSIEHWIMTISTISAPPLPFFLNVLVRTKASTSSDDGNQKIHFAVGVKINGIPSYKYSCATWTNSPRSVATMCIYPHVSTGQHIHLRDMIVPHAMSSCATHPCVAIVQSIHFQVLLDVFNCRNGLAQKG